MNEDPKLWQRIFVSRNLRMDMVQAVGFDMDYTLARYRREAIEEAAYKLALENMIRKGYPSSIRALSYQPSFVIRGLAVDKLEGNIVKLDRHQHPCRVYHGFRLLSKEERRATYRREKVRFHPPRFAHVDTLFSLPEVCLYAQLVDELGKSNPNLDTWRLYDDTRDSIDEAHRNDTLKTLIKDDIPRFIEKDPLLARTLHKLRSSGKRLFVLTNSFWPYTQAVMTYLLEGQLPEYTDWKQYFDLICVGAAKPSFFSEDTPFVEVAEEGGVVHREVTSLVKGRVYQGGNLKAVEEAMGLGGEEILYVGDHIYGDILRSKKQAAWRTALVVEELEDELKHTVEHRDTLMEIAELERDRRILDHEANSLRRTLARLEKSDGKDSAQYQETRAERDLLKGRLKDTLKAQDDRATKVGAAFNPYWGMVLKETGDNTRFAHQLEAYACLYTSRVSNFYHYSAHQYFRSSPDLMPHERGLFAGLK